MEFRTRARRRGRMRAAMLACLMLVSLVVAGCGNGTDAGGTAAASAPRSSATGDPSLADAVAVDVGPVVRAPMASLYSTSATLRADKRATVTARTSGVIREILVEEGDRVEAGRPLAVLEDDEQRIAWERANAAAETKARELERAEALHRQGLMADEEYETIRREAVDLAHSADLAELALSRTTIHAPFAGQIVVRHLDPGATVVSGAAMFDIADLDPLYADVQVPERQIARLSPGQVVRVSSDTAASEGEAVIERIAPAVDPETGTVKVTVAVRPGAGLRPGGFVRVGIVTDVHENALVVPRSALVAEGRRWLVYRFDGAAGEAGGPVEQIEVVRGFEEGNRVEILSTEDVDQALSEGDRVVVTGASSLSDGATVRVLGDGAERAEEETGVPA